MRNKLTGIWALAAQLILGGVALFYLAGAAYGLISLQYHRGIALFYSFAAGFILYGASAKSRSDRPSWWDLFFILLSAAGVWYWILEHESLAYRAGAYTAMDVALGTVITLLALEVSRRALGRPILVVALLALLYACFGSYLPTVSAIADSPCAALSNTFTSRQTGRSVSWPKSWPVTSSLLWSSAPS